MSEIMYLIRIYKDVVLYADITGKELICCWSRCETNYAPAVEKQWVLKDPVGWNVNREYTLDYFNLTEQTLQETLKVYKGIKNGN